MKSILLILLLCCCRPCVAQVPDSMDMYAAAADTAGIDRLINYCFAHKSEQTENCFLFSKRALEKSAAVNYRPGQARSLTNLGAIETLRGNYAAALQYYFDALKIWESLQHKRGIMLTKNNIGDVYGVYKNYGKQYQYLNEALLLAEENGFADGMALVKQNLGIYFTAKGDFKTAFKNQYESVLLFLQQNKLNDAAVGYNNAGASWFYMNEPDSALYYYNKAKAIGLQLQDNRVLSTSFANIAEVYEGKNKTAEAVEMYNQGIVYAGYSGLKEQLLFCYSQLAGIYQKKGDYAAAIQYIKLQAAVKDSLINLATAKQVNELQAKYDTEKNERTIQLQRFEITKRNYWIGGIAGMLLLGSLLAFSYYKRRKLATAQQLQQAIMKQQDIATKAVIEAEEKERKRIAGDLHDGVGQIMSAAKMNLSSLESRLHFNTDDDRVAFEKIVNLVDESCKEVRSVSHNMMPNALLKSGLSSAVKEFIDKIDSKVLQVNLYSEGLNERLDSNVETVLYRVVQECVNNVIKHSGANKLDISLIKDEDGIACTVEDNGKGFVVTDKEKAGGIGLKNIKTRIGYLKGTVDFDSSPGKGTLVAIHVPLLP